MLVLSYVSSVDVQHLVTFIQPWHARISWHSSSNTTYYDGHSLINTTFDVEPKPVVIIEINSINYQFN